MPDCVHKYLTPVPPEVFSKCCIGMVLPFLGALVGASEKLQKNFRTFRSGLYMFLMCFSHGHSGQARYPQTTGVRHGQCPSPVTPLSPHWAFVVQLRQGTALTSQAIQGRVEHITSGRAADFGSLDALLALIAQVLTPPAEQPP